MENFVICSNCGTKNRAVKKVCYACLKPIGRYRYNPSGKIERNAKIVEDVESEKMTYTEIAKRNNISPARVHQIYQQAQHRRKITPELFKKETNT